MADDDSRDVTDKTEEFPDLDALAAKHMRELVRGSKLLSEPVRQAASDMLATGVPSDLSALMKVLGVESNAQD